jgi:hypothetical protein
MTQIAIQEYLDRELVEMEKRSATSNTAGDDACPTRGTVSEGAGPWRPRETSR